MSVQSFMREFREHTTQGAFRRTAIWRGAVWITLDPHYRSVGLGRIESTQRGFASAALDWLGELADRHAVKMNGVIEPFGSARLNTVQLTRWYQRHGWTITNGCYIDRAPRAQERNAA